MNFPFNNRGWFLPAITTAASFLSKKENPFIEAGKAVLGSAASGVGSAVGGALGGKLSDKITGIPSALSATEQGTQAAEYMNAAYPGTTPWDRLGAGGGGSPSALSASNVERMKMRQENKMQSRQLSTQAMIADKQNRAHLISTASGYGISGIKEVLKAYDGFRTQPYDTPVQQGRERLPSEIRSKEYGALTPAKTIADSLSPFFKPKPTKNRGAGGSFKSIKEKIGTFLFNREKPDVDLSDKNIPYRYNFSPIRK